VIPYQNAPLRLVLIHLNPLSARLRFLKINNRHLCMPAPLPALSDWLENEPKRPAVAYHPNQALKQVCSQLDIDPALLAIEPGFRMWVDTPAQALPVYMARASTPSPIPAPEHCQWIELPDCFSMLQIERDIMQGIYRWFLE